MECGFAGWGFEQEAVGGNAKEDSGVINLELYKYFSFLLS
jgi:hypothetical protein